MASKGVKTCLGVSLLFLIIVVGVIVTLSLTIFKIRDPDVSVHPLGLKNLNFSFSPNTNMSMPMLITIVNHNHGSFRYKNSTGYVNYGGTVVAEVPMLSSLVPPRSSINVTSYASFMIGRLLENPKFWSDIVTGGTLNMTSTTALPGKVIALKIIKLKATAYTTCDISLNIISKTADTKCISKLKL
ncbi:hypothetical protein RIF29_27382 [Crotalaria pallida]|uniref:Late embryogenesis abundant protein LEA-2 subgroup domain-containing protein n=1 Tax=Crotalaria pallida TaxID=3830 RepID=A0AAN9EW65_CROPI